MTKGLEVRPERRKVEVGSRRVSLPIELTPLEALPPLSQERWSSGDLHVHMNYGGTYRNTPERLRFQAEAEDLDVVHNLIVNKEQRVPDIEYFTASPTACRPRTSFSSIVRSSIPATRAISAFSGSRGTSCSFRTTPPIPIPPRRASTPRRDIVSDLAQRRAGSSATSIPTRRAPPDPECDPSVSHAPLIDVALGTVDYLEVMGFSDHSARLPSVWYRFLNSGFRLPAGAGTDHGELRIAARAQWD